MMKTKKNKWKIGNQKSEVGGQNSEAFRADSSAADANVYSASDIKEYVETYANHIA